MAKYIDAENLSQAKFPIPASGKHSPYEIGWNDAINAIIENTPTADVQEVRHGEWICHISDIFPAESTMECSLCHNERDLGYADKYCPNCGAKMNLEEFGK